MASRFHPGQFPVGSPSSRAAARSLIQERRSHASLVDLILYVEGMVEPHFGIWEKHDNGSFTRRSEIPAGMTFDEAERIAGVPQVETQGKYVRFHIDDHIQTTPSEKHVNPKF